MLVLAALGCAVGDRSVVTVDGTRRNYYAVVPEGLTAPPVVVVFHGGGPAGSNKGRRMAVTTGFGELAAEEGFVAVFPSSYEGNWDDGRDAPFVPPEGIEDLAFVDALLDDLSSKHAIDRDRVYAAGISNGGFFTNHLACNRTASFAGFANLIGGMPEGYTCTPAGPAPMLLIPGTGDLLVPYEGGNVAAEEGEEAVRGRVIPQEDNRAFWVAHNGCTGEPAATQLPDIAPDDGSTVRSLQWTACAGGSEVQALVMEGGGHGWPGGSQYLPASMIGPVNQDFEAERAMWDFFSRHSR